MAKRRTDQEWKNLFEQYESSQLSQRVFCEHGNRMNIPVIQGL
ncbi:hypothetical protein KKIDH5335_07420 [Vibrio fluvialis]|nr:hypothetical protein KKIDH5335_07420 [Vibrio fluvialis]